MKMSMPCTPNGGGISGSNSTACRCDLSDLAVSRSELSAAVVRIRESPELRIMIEAMIDRFALLR